MKKGLNILLRIGAWTSGILVFLALLSTALLYIYQDKIKLAAISEANKYLNTKVDVHPSIKLSIWKTFPYASVELRQVKIYESIKNSDSLLGKAETVQLRVNLQTLFKGQYNISQIYIEEGNFHLKILADGSTNYDIIKTPDKTTNDKNDTHSADFKLSDIIVKNCFIDFENRPANQRYRVQSHYLKSSFEKTNENYTIQLRGNQFIHAIQIDQNTFLQKKEVVLNTTMEFKTQEKKFILNPTIFSIDKSKYKANGYYAYNTDELIHFELENDISDIQSLLSLIPAEYTQSLKTYKSTGKVYFKALIDGNLTKYANPLVQINFGLDNVSLYHPKIKKSIQQIHLHGSFGNGSDHNSKSSVLDIRDMKCMLDGEKIEGSFKLSNFQDPSLALKAKGVIRLASAMPFIENSIFKQGNGKINFDFKLEGKSAHFKTKSGHEHIQTEGEIVLDSISLTLADKTLPITIPQTTLLFNKNDLAINNFKIGYGKSDLELNGFVKNAFGSLFLEKGKMLIQADLNSSYFQLEEILGLIPTQNPKDNYEDIAPPKGTFPYLEKYTINLNSSFDKVDYKKISMKKVSCEIGIAQPILELKNLSFEIGGGLIKANSTAVIHSEHKIESSIQANIQKLRIDSLLYGFDQFGQDFISDKQLKGIFTGSVNTNFEWNKDGVINTKTLLCNIDMTIQNGQLVKFEPMQKLSAFLKTDELQDVKFSEMRNKIFIENENITLPEMKIQSNVADFTISGTHGFSGDIKYYINFPLKNLKKHKIDPDASFGASDENKTNGTTLFLLIDGTTTNFSIKYDTRNTKKKIKEDLKKEKEEFLQLFRKKEDSIQQIKPNTEEYFDF